MLVLTLMIHAFLSPAAEAKAVASLARECIPLVITHPHAYFDEDLSAKAGVNAELKRRKTCNASIDVLVRDTYPTYLDENLASHFHSSLFGETDLYIPGAKIEVIGGFFGQCHERTIESLISNRFAHQDESNLEVVVPIDATYVFNEADAPHDRITLSKLLEEKGGDLNQFKTQNKNLVFNFDMSAALIQRAHPSVCVIFRFQESELKYQRVENCLTQVVINLVETPSPI